MKKSQSLFRNKTRTSVPSSFYELYVKRQMDILLSIFALIILTPLLLLLAGIIRIELGSPVIYIQKRPGLNEKIFHFLKFRTMTNRTYSNGNLLPDRDRITNFGKLLRSTSLDELPELINILKGDMSIVGPRPLLVQYLPLYTDDQKKRHLVRPGLSGLAQIKGRNTLSWEKKFFYDVTYCRNISFLLDLVIIFLTFRKLANRSDVNSLNHETMEDYLGT